MKRLLSWCRRPYLRIHFAPPDALRLADDALKAAHAATQKAHEALELYRAASEQLAQLREDQAQIAELERRSRLSFAAHRKDGRLDA